MPQPALLTIEDLHVSFATPSGRVRALRGVSCQMKRGRITGIVGESGSGKSTLAYAVMRYLGGNGKITGGRILFDGEDLLTMPRAEFQRLRGSRMSMVYQDAFSSLNPSITVGEQVAEAVRHRERVPKGKVYERTLELLEAVNIPSPADVARRYPHELSGGQQQRIVIAMALAGDPDLIILDEPTTGLDVTTEAQILELLSHLAEQLSAAVVFVSHNLGVVARLCDDVIVMYAGEVVEAGPVTDLFRWPRHPYTAALLDSLPRLGGTGRKQRLNSLEGALPDNRQDYPACIFVDRCPMAEERCRAEKPQLEPVAGAQHSRCFRWEALPERAPAQQEQGQAQSEVVSSMATQRSNATQGSNATQRSNAAQQSARGRPNQESVATYEPEEVLLKTEALSKRYPLRSGFLPFGPKRYVRAVNEVSVEVPRGRTLSIVGESGCGKTTLARSIVGLLAPSEGTITFQGTDVSVPVERRDAETRREIQMVFQNPDSSLNPRHTIRQLLARPLKVLRGVPPEKMEAEIVRLLKSVRLDERYLDRYPHQLSGGEKQRVAIARAFASEPQLLVCDEPVSALDVSVQASVLNLFLDLQERSGVAYIFISHDLSVVWHISDYIAVMYLGTICEIGPAEQVLNPPFHPYTEALLSAVPIPDPEAKQKPVRLQGPIPNPANPPQGCPFHTRCPYKIGEICEAEKPPVRELEGGHRIACHLAVEELLQHENPLGHDLSA